MQISYASEPGSSRANEDYAICGLNWSVLLDGATAMPGVDSGCIHDVPWLVQHLAAALAWRLTLGTTTALDDILAAAIEEVCAAHSDTCDLSNPDSPSSTVAIARVTNSATLDYITLADSPIVLWNSRETSVQVFEDQQIAQLPGGRPYTVELVRSSRNNLGGFWVASTKPDAAYHAIRGTTDLKPGAEVALFTDGVTRLVDYYGQTWDSLFNLLRDLQPQGLVKFVRDMERQEKVPFGKRHDDATVAYMTAI